MPSQAILPRRAPDLDVMRLKMLQLTVAVLLLTLVSGSKCPDQQLCGDEQTCCQTLTSGEYDCCPFHQGECCEDHTHCCPEGFLCQVTEAKCSNATHSVPWAERLPSHPKSFRMISSSVAGQWNSMCPDASSCPPEFSCLKLSDMYGCCPVEEGMACSDEKHCCPNNHKCSDDSTFCLKRTDSDVPCNDTAACPDGSTCCKTKDGQWACCPLEQAVCCEDFIHCCPHGKKCNVAAGTCEDASGSTPWLEKSPSHVILSTGRRSFANMSCDSGHSCPDSTTCCKHVDAHWSCCPLKEGVCCIDRFHCCPHDTSCNMKTLTCDSSTSSIPMTVLPPSKKDKDVKVEENDLNQCVQCDHHTSCPDHTTCCFMHQTHKWGCCPLADAVCCNGGEHCCPKDYSCQGDSCVKSDWLQVDSLPLTSNRVSATQQIQKDIQCGGGFSCHDDQTCCKISETSWGCCPLPKAVCCSDMVHCCPAGLSCGEGGTCVQGTGFGWNHWENFLRKKK